PPACSQPVFDCAATVGAAKLSAAPGGRVAAANRINGNVVGKRAPGERPELRSKAARNRTRGGLASVEGRETARSQRGPRSVAACVRGSIRKIRCPHSSDPED